MVLRAVVESRLHTTWEGTYDNADPTPDATAACIALSYGVHLTACTETYCSSHEQHDISVVATEAPRNLVISRYPDSVVFVPSSAGWRWLLVRPRVCWLWVRWPPWLALTPYHRISRWARQQKWPSSHKPLNAEPWGPSKHAIPSFPGAKHLYDSHHQACAQPLILPKRVITVALQVEVRRAALPRGHPSRVNGRLSAAAAFAAEGQGDQAVTLVER